MSGVSVKQGDPIPLAIKLWDLNTGKFVRARVFDNLDNEVVGSPITLAHQTEGYYTGTGINMPNAEAVHAVYEVFDDAPFSTRSDNYQPATESFELDNIGTAVDDLVSASRKADFIAEVSDDDGFNAEIADEDTVTGAVSDTTDIEAEVDDTGDIAGATDDGLDINAQIEDC